MAAEDPRSPLRKKVDESWKDSVQKEKESLSPGAKKNLQGEGLEEDSADTGFSFFISTLGMQTLIALGEVAHPSTGEKTAELSQAKYLIDVIQMLSDKTRGNLSAEETTAIQNLLYELRMKFVQKSGPA